MTPHLPFADLRCPPQAKPEISRFPNEKPLHMPGSSTTPGRIGARIGAPIRVAFRVVERVGTQRNLVIAAQWLACACPCRRFAIFLAEDNARLGDDADCYSFIVADLHRLLFAGFSGAPTIKVRLSVNLDEVRQAKLASSSR